MPEQEEEWYGLRNLNPDDSEVYCYEYRQKELPTYYQVVMFKSDPNCPVYLAYDKESNEWISRVPEGLPAEAARTLLLCTLLEKERAKHV